MNKSEITLLIHEQKRVIERRRIQVGRDAADLCADLIANYRIVVRAEFDGFLWDYIDLYARQAATILGNGFSETMESHLHQIFQPMQTGLSETLREKDADLCIKHSELELERRALLLSVADMPFKRALHAIKPNLISQFFAPNIGDDGWDDWDRKQLDSAVNAVCAVVDGMNEDMARSYERIIDSALDEYEQFLSSHLAARSTLMAS